MWKHSFHVFISREEDRVFIGHQEIVLRGGEGVNGVTVYSASLWVQVRILSTFAKYRRRSHTDLQPHL